MLCVDLEGWDGTGVEGRLKRVGVCVCVSVSLCVCLYVSVCVCVVMALYLYRVTAD